VCEYRRRVKEDLVDAFPPEVVSDARTALSLSRRHEVDRRPEGWTWALEVLVNVATIEDHKHKRWQRLSEDAGAGSKW
jgi:hypothetical protein